jgi:hypothetical protein
MKQIFIFSIFVFSKVALANTALQCETHFDQNMTVTNIGYSDYSSDENKKNGILQTGVIYRSLLAVTKDNVVQTVGVAGYNKQKDGNQIFLEGLIVLAKDLRVKDIESSQEEGLAVPYLKFPDLLQIRQIINNLDYSKSKSAPISLKRVRDGKPLIVTCEVCTLANPDKAGSGNCGDKAFYQARAEKNGEKFLGFVN